ncbi:hypothetical protein Bca4012_049742 [Brassica carinata]
MMETNLQRLSQCLLDTLSPDSELRRAAEALLLDAAVLPDYGPTVLRLVGDSSDDQTRHVASLPSRTISVHGGSLTSSSLISQLKVAASAHDYASVNGILGTVNSICEKFRHKYMTDDQLLDLKYCHDTENDDKQLNQRVMESRLGPANSTKEF